MAATSGDFPEFGAGAVLAATVGVAGVGAGLGAAIGAIQPTRPWWRR